MKDIIELIIIGLLGAGGIVQFLINRHDNKQRDKIGIDEKFESIDSKFDELKNSIEQLTNSLTELKTDLATNNAQMDCQNEVLKELAHDRLIEVCDYYINLGRIPDTKLAALKRLADAYKGVGGNGDVPPKMAIVEKLYIEITNQSLTPIEK